MAAGDDWRYTLPAFCALTNIDWLAVQIQYKYMQYKHRLICDPVHSRHLVDHHQHLAAANHPLPPPSCPPSLIIALPSGVLGILGSSVGRLVSGAWSAVLTFLILIETKQWERMEKISYEWINSWLPSESSVDHLVPKELSQQYLCIQKGLHEKGSTAFIKGAPSIWALPQLNC